MARQLEPPPQPLDSHTHELLKLWRQRQQAECEEWNHAYEQWQHRKPQPEEPSRKPPKQSWKDTGLVFTWQDGRAYHPQYLSQAFDRLIKKVDMPPIRLHDLRHCAATLSPAAGIHMKKIQALLGHSRYSLTADTYTSVLPQFEKAEAEAPVALVPRAGQQQEPRATPDVPSDDLGKTAA
ncbi:tyrosine-type recombinase/integrase [Streptomyces sp. tea 10]|nr:tyrosine-type recombinase/integrase [Streptomyces sp. tea 10]